jgi:hypothetical protein
MTFEERIIEAVENAVIHDIGRYNIVQFKKFMLPDDVIEDVYRHVDLEKIKRYLTENIEQLIAKKIVDSMMAEVATDVKQIVATKAIREDMRYYLRQKMEQAMQGVADAEPPVDAEPAV